MKHIIVIFSAMMISLSSFAQSDDYFGNVVFQGGYNLLEKQPVANIAFVGDVWIFRGKIEIGPGFLPYPGSNETHLFSYFAPSLGLVWGYKHLVYLLAGGMPWGDWDYRDGKPKFSQTVWHFKVECGTDIHLSDTFFLNLEIMYLLPRLSNSPTNCKNLSLRGGLGIYF